MSLDGHTCVSCKLTHLLAVARSDKGLNRPDVSDTIDPAQIKLSIFHVFQIPSPNSVLLYIQRAALKGDPTNSSISLFKNWMNDIHSILNQYAPTL